MPTHCCVCTFSMFFADTKIRRPQTAHRGGGKGRGRHCYRWKLHFPFSFQIQLHFFFTSLLFCVDILLLFQTASTNFYLFVFECFNDKTQPSFHQSAKFITQSTLSSGYIYCVLRCIPYLFPLGHVGPRDVFASDSLSIVDSEPRINGAESASAQLGSHFVFPLEVSIVVCCKYFSCLRPFCKLFRSSFKLVLYRRFSHDNVWNLSVSTLK